MPGAQFGHAQACLGRARRTGPRRAVALAVAAVLAVGSVGAVVAREAPSTGTRAGFSTSCPVLPATNVWNRRVDSLPVRSDSATLMNRMGLTRYLHPDFGSYEGYGIPVNLVTAATPRSPVAFTWPSESDAGPYPIPASPKIEGAGAAGDRHILMLDTKACRLWELFAASKNGSRLVGRLRGDLRPPLERAPAERLDVAPTRRACRSTRGSPATRRSPPA